MTRQEAFELYASGPDRLEAALSEFPKEMWQFKPKPEAWSVHEMLIHLPDAEASGYVRCRKIIAQSGVTVDVYDQDLWATGLKYHALSTDTALSLFRAMRALTVEVLQHVDETTWSNHVTHLEDGEMTLEVWLERYAVHVDMHIAQMKRNLEAWKAAGCPGGSGT
jgi:hypothetical protein